MNAEDEPDQYGSPFSDIELEDEMGGSENAQILSQVLGETSNKRIKLDASQDAEIELFKTQKIDIDTLRKRLAGPSVAKPGQEGVDQDRVNQIIYEASEGSKYFKNEKKKDAELTEKIRRTQKRAKEVLAQTADLAADERRIDLQIASIESTIDLSQFIMHIDCDAFYASVEELDRPELKEVPMGVGIGVLTTANYHARKFGVRSAMPTYIAKKLCPDLVCVPLNFTKYIQKAEEIRAVLAKADPDYQAASLDEAYLNITAYVDSLNMTPDQAVAELRQEIYMKTGLTVSAGIAANSRLAKIGSNRNKPNGQFRLANDRRAILDFMSTLPVRKVNGIGKVLERQLDAIGVKQCKDIYTHRALLSRLFGQKTFDFLLGVYLGVGSTNIKPAEDHERKSIGTESTFRSLTDPIDLMAKLKHTAEELEKDCIRANWAGRTLHLKIKKHTYEVYTRQRSLPRPVYTAKDLYEFAVPLLEKEFPLNLRLMGLRLTHLTHVNKKSAAAFFEGFGYTTEQKPITRNALFTAEQEEILEGDAELADEVDANWTLANDSVRKQAKLHDRAHVSTETTPKAELPECPICQRRIPGEESAVAMHVDSCLNNQAIREVLKEVPEQVEKKPVLGKRTALSNWLKK